VIGPACLSQRTQRVFDLAIIEIRPFRNGWQVYEAALNLCSRRKNRQSITRRVVRAFALVRFAFWIQLARSHVSFHSMRQIEDCQASALRSLQDGAARRPHEQDVYFVLAQDSLEGPLCPFALIAVTS
jgi:hypothetical protein